MELEGRTAFITGAGGGIGTAVALALAAQGVDAIAVDRDIDAAGATAAAVGRTGREAIAVHADVATNADVTAAVAAGLDRFGKIDICVNAVGVGGVARVVDHPDELWHHVIAINLTSAFLVCRAVLPSMIDRGRGRIVNITSRAAYRSSAGTAAYAASKGGLLAFSRVLAVEAGEHGITVNNVAPGTTLTPMVERGIGGPDAQLREAVQSGVLIRPPRLADPSEIAAAVVFLCGPGSDFTTGTTLHVNGGAYCRVSAAQGTIGGPVAAIVAPGDMSNVADRALGHDKHMVPMTDRKAEIVGVAGRLMAERGIDGASLRHIGDAVGMRRGSLYAHFDAKEEIVELVLGPALAALRDVLSEPPEPGQSALNHLRARFQAAVECTIEYRDAFLILFQDRRLIDESVLLRPLSDEANAITPLWIKLIEAGQAEGSLRSDLHPTTIALGLYTLLVAAFSNRHLGLEVAGGQLGSDAIVGHVVTLFFDGVLT